MINVDFHWLCPNVQNCKMLNYRYNKLCGMVKKLAHVIKKLDVKDEFRVEASALLIEKLYVHTAHTSVAL